MGHLMNQYPSDYIAMVIMTLSLLLCPGTGLLLNDSSRMPVRSNGSDTFVLASKSLATQTHSKPLEKYPPSNVNITSLEVQDLCSTREKLRTSIVIRNLSILMTNEDESMNQSRTTSDMVQGHVFPTDEQGFGFDNGNWIQERQLTNLLVTNCSIDSLSVVSEIRLPNKISGASTEKLNETFRPNKRTCSNVAKYSPMLSPGKFFIPPYSRTKINFTVKVKGNDEYETGYDNSEISASKQEHRVNKISTKNDTDYDKCEISKSIQKHNLNNNSTGNETNYDNSAISASMQKQSLNNNVIENETDYNNIEI
ncbi:hypothetical protein PoB_005965300 [Plakobranchus ocellatus]|uniref:Uncharacterized protein n=1 Tax=Plakobranchus ocellatus TaxID=259542 RepID=A0AAV4CNA2_9GAST|nr:hypothetical protein PoB_005965300 [Plakobranchus ocellatus]